MMNYINYLKNQIVQQYKYAEVARAYWKDGRKFALQKINLRPAREQ
jgi:hypothetical protein